MELRKNFSNKKIANKKENNSRSEKIEKVNVHKDHRGRLKSQFLKSGFSSLTEIQQLELLLFYAKPLADTNPLAHKLLDKFGSLNGVLTADYKELVKVDGVKENTATLITFLHELISNFHINKNDDEIVLNSTRLARHYASSLFVGATVEQFYVICLTNANVVKKTILLQNGTANEVAVDIRNITGAILDSNCNKIIICHNHPEGVARMSDNDCNFTYSLLCSCLLNSIYVVDHIIVGTDKAISLHEQGVIDKLVRRATSVIQLSNKNKNFLASQSEKYVIDSNE